MDPVAAQKSYMNIRWDAAFKESMICKRLSPYSTLTVETQIEQLQKFRAIEKDGKIQRVATAQVIEKVSDVFDCSEDTSSEVSSSESSDCDACSVAESSDCDACSVAESSDCDACSVAESSDCDVCSVGSCSVNYRSQDHYRPSQESDDLCSDAESCCGSGSSGRVRDSFYSQEDVETNIHRLELQAYRSTLEALYASGPLSWKQEALLKNLRITLNISNDDHLIELRSLISGKTSTNGNSWMHIHMVSRVCFLLVAVIYWAIRVFLFLAEATLW